MIEMAAARIAGATSLAESLPQGLFTPALTRALATSIARAVPVATASAGFVYEFDWESGTFKREAAILGQLYLEGPDPVGKGRLNVTASYERVRIDTLQGKDIGNLMDAGGPIFLTNPRGPLFTIPHFGMDLDTRQVTLGATYGVTDDLELNVTALALTTDADADVVLKGTAATNFRTEAFGSSASETGVGDLLLRGKWRLVQRDWLHVASGLVMRVPTGDRENFQGTGAVELAPMLYASLRPLVVHQHLGFRPYLNAGFNFDADDVNGSEARWGVGVDGALGERLTVGVAFLGRHPVSRLAPPGSFDLRRGENGQFSAPLFGLSTGREDFYDFSGGGRLNVWRDRVNVFANVLVPLNRDGARADAIPLAGAELTF